MENQSITPNIMRTDAAKQFDWSAKWETRQFINEPPALATYVVTSNCMEHRSANAIFEGDELRVEYIALSQIIDGKNYVITDTAGNTYLGVVNGVSENAPLILKSLNTAYMDVIMPQNEIALIGLVYLQSRNVLPDEALHKLFE